MPRIRVHSRQRCRRIQNKLQICVALFTLVTLFFHIYSQSSSKPINHDVQGLEKPLFTNRSNINRTKVGFSSPGVFQDRGRLTTIYHKPAIERQTKAEEDIKRFIVRRTLTKSPYPMTLTAPYRTENPQICSGVNVTVLFMVHTATNHFDRRQGIRETFGNRNIFKTIHNRIVFLLGRTTDNITEEKILDENSKYRDIVQGEFMDTYHNLTLKGVMGLRWVTKHCRHAKLLVKMDDDFFVDVFKVVEIYVPEYATKSKQIVCNPMVPSPVLRDRGRWHVSGDYFRGVETYPKYCSGFTVFMTTDVIKIMYQAAFFTPFFWIDDVYLFGLLPSKLYIGTTDFENFSLSLEECFDSYKSSKPSTYVSCSVNKEKTRKWMWKRTLEKLSETTRKTVNDAVLASEGS